MQTHTPTLLATALLLAGPYGFAQEPPPETTVQAAKSEPVTKEDEVKALRQEVQELKERLDKSAATSDVQGVQTDLENFKYQYQRDRETKSALSNRNLLITGVIQTRYAYTSKTISSSDATVGYLANSSVNNPNVIRDRHSTFDTPWVQVGFSGLLFRDYEKARNLGFNFSVASAPATSNYGASSSNKNGQTITTNTNSFLNVLDANVVYQALPTIENDGDRLSFTLGQQLLPFGVEAAAGEDLKPVINAAQFVAGAGLGAWQRQVGLVAKGEFFANYDFGYNYRQALISFAAGVVNGNGPNHDDDNGHKDLFGRVALTVPASYQSWLRELRFGASIYKGQVNVLNAAATSFVDYGAKNRYGFDVYYNHFPFGFTFEDVRATNGTLNSAGTAATSTYSRGRTGTFFFSFGQQFLSSIKNQGKFDDWWPKTFQPFVRFDTWDPNVDKVGDRININTVGLNIFFAETTKAQINLNHRDQQVVTSGTDYKHVKSNELLVQLQFGF